VTETEPALSPPMPSNSVITRAVNIHDQKRIKFAAENAKFMVILPS